MKGSTAGRADSFRAACAGGARGPDLLYATELAEASRVRFILDAPGFDGVLHLHRGCPGALPTLACSDDFDAAGRSLVFALIDAGPVAAVVDGAAAGDAGEFTLTMEARPLAAPPAAGEDTCAGAPPVTTAGGGGVTTAAIEGSTFHGADDVEPSCAGAPGGPDIFRRLDIAFPSILTISTKSSQFPGIVLALLEGCAAGDGELACDVESVEKALPAGSYVLAVDGAGADQAGDFALGVQVTRASFLDERCAAGAPLAAGATAAGATAGEGSFAGGCGCGGKGPEGIHLLTLKKPGSVRIEVNPDGFDSVVYVRKSCADPGSQVACNDDAGSALRSVVETQLGKGTWAVFVDGCREGDAGSYTIRAIVQ